MRIQGVSKRPFSLYHCARSVEDMVGKVTQLHCWQPQYAIHPAIFFHWLLHMKHKQVLFDGGVLIGFINICSWFCTIMQICFFFMSASEASDVLICSFFICSFLELKQSPSYLSKLGQASHTWLTKQIMHTKRYIWHDNSSHFIYALLPWFIQFFLWSSMCMLL